MAENNRGKKPADFLANIKQSAGRFVDQVKNREKTPKKSRKDMTPAEKRASRKKVWFWVGTAGLVCVLTLVIFVGIFLTYINQTMKGKVEVNMDEFDLSVSTELYYKDPAAAEETWVMYQTLYKGENRILVSSEQIPQHVKNAAIAIEDRRFESHKGVDWIGTMRAIFKTVTGGSVQGGSTITQQLIKNTTGDDEVTIKRKVTEIYRALALEKEYDKDEILTAYLNTIYFGQSCNGVQTGSRTYFGKDIEELTVAEGACLISITNNPSMYDPLISDWTREKNRERQLLVLGAMLEQEMLDQATYDAAVAEEIVFTNGYTNLGNFTGEKGDGEGDKEEVRPANNSYFTDTVIEDVAKAFIELFDLKDDEERTAYQKAVNMVYAGGYKIYTTQNINYQKIMEEEFANTSIRNHTDSFGQPLQAAMTLMDPYTGDVLGIVGGTGVKTVDRGWNWAIEPRQCGSAIKPISVYAPALDDKTISAATAIDDYPVNLEGKGAYPQNVTRRYDGIISVRDAIFNSVNTAAVRVCLDYGVKKSYTFMTETLGFTTLTDTDSKQVGNMALGGFDVGVTPLEMTAAYCIFPNDGVYTTPRTFVRVEDSEGNLVLSNETESRAAIKASTAYLMRGFLSAAAQNSSAPFSGMSVGGKTGSTNDYRDRYFVGYTPYYCAAVWTGYKSNEIISGVSGNPSAKLWEAVMIRVHEGKSNPGFSGATGVTSVTVCKDSGLLATDACAHDVRGDRIHTVTIASGTAPSKSCNVHKMVSYCSEGKHIATPNCPASTVSEVALLDLNREEFEGVTATDTEFTIQAASKEELCPAHSSAPVLPPDSGDGNGGDSDGTGGEGTGGEGNTPSGGEGNNPSGGEGDDSDDNQAAG